MQRILYTLQLARRHAKQLAQTVRDHTLQAQSVLALDLDRLHQSGYQTLILDFDGVLAAHAAPEPHPAVTQWLNEACAKFGQQQIFILSNKPTETRQHYFNQHYPAIRFIVAKRKKPYPDGLAEVLQLCGSPKPACIIIDDRLLTGVLAAIAFGIGYQWITAPFKNYAKNPIRETWFDSLRYAERLFFRRLPSNQA